jgi:hypothetical protein
MSQGNPRISIFSPNLRLATAIRLDPPPRAIMGKKREPIDDLIDALVWMRREAKRRAAQRQRRIALPAYRGRSQPQRPSILYIGGNL